MSKYINKQEKFTYRSYRGSVTQGGNDAFVQGTVSLKGRKRVIVKKVQWDFPELGLGDTLEASLTFGTQSTIARVHNPTNIDYTRLSAKDAAVIPSQENPVVKRPSEVVDTDNLFVQFDSNATGATNILNYKITVMERKIGF